jgi:hypothetical protein
METSFEKRRVSRSCGSLALAPLVNLSQRIDRLREVAEREIHDLGLTRMSGVHVSIATLQSAWYGKGD